MSLKRNLDRIILRDPDGFRRKGCVLLTWLHRLPANPVAMTRDWPVLGPVHFLLVVLAGSKGFARMIVLGLMSERARAGGFMLRNCSGQVE